jgi:hypothetical protein
MDPEIWYGTGFFLFIKYELKIKHLNFWYSVVKFETVRYGTVRYGTKKNKKYGTVRYGTVRKRTEKHGTRGLS